MKLTLEIDLDNADFSDPFLDSERGRNVLRAITPTIEVLSVRSNGFRNNERCRVRDVNGNAVGTVSTKGAEQ